ncbi:uncharacterized protein LOC123554018 [Mercenaria mercenaria]|uniref:uncharacterized protein LOC123554018 n=1 Tax=Mercenaria mercenaria TaxID=6596 RepID=UPI00234F1052|nr:uncharacterized protein LOC123554018 [Mercenaria mercenaria]
MCDPHDCPMIYRYMRRRKGHILLIVTSLVVLYVWTDTFDTYTDYGRDENELNCKFPCIGQFCMYCRTPAPTTIKVINIAEHLNLKQALRGYRSESNSTKNVSSSEQVCKRPSFDLKHDSVKYAFFKMAPLNCSKEELFYLEDNVFKFNKTQLGNRELEKCMYYGVERVSDDFASYTEALTKESEPFDLVLMHDFVRIKCFLKKDKEAEEKDIKFDSENEEQHNQNNDIPDNLEEEMRNKIKVNYSNIDTNFGLKNNTVKIKDEGEVNVQGVYRARALMDYGHYDELESFDADNNTYLGNNYDNYFRHYWGDDTFQFDEPADFEQLFVQVNAKPEVFERIANKISSRLTQRKMNVLMFGLDSMSHLSYQRKLPNTYKYLMELGAVVMDGYNIVGDATTAALIPMLTGKTEMELPEVRKNQFDSDVVDVYPLVWNKYQERGYVTMFGEDEPSIGVFNLRLNGFRDPPTDHYMRPFWQALWDSELRKESQRYCTGNTPNHMYLIKYMKDFFEKYDNVSKFAFMFGSELTHWDNNPGEYMDDDFVGLFKFLKLKGHLENTVLIVFGDHGARYSKVRYTVQGKMEERLPLMSLTFPKWFRVKYPHLFKNLKKNSNKLTTPFDIHETLLDILDLRRTISRTRRKQRGISLLDQVPPERTCSDANIDIHWCTCLKQLELDARDKHVQQSVKALMNFLNKETKRMRQFCMELKFNKLLHAFLLVPNEKVLMFLHSKDDDNRVANFTSDVNVDHAHFQITIETLPNHGLYESTVQVNMTSGMYTVIETEISRLDMYGSQPACIQEKYPDLRKYCYCKNQESEKKNSTRAL